MYKPGKPPADMKDMGAWLTDEFEAISVTLQHHDPDITSNRVWQSTPPRPRVGDVAFFAADVHSPGSAEGLWEYLSTGWVKI